MTQTNEKMNAARPENVPMDQARRIVADNLGITYLAARQYLEATQVRYYDTNVTFEQYERWLEEHAPDGFLCGGVAVEMILQSVIKRHEPDFEAFSETQPRIPWSTVDGSGTVTARNLHGVLASYQYSVDESGCLRWRPLEVASSITKSCVGTITLRNDCVIATYRYFVDETGAFLLHPICESGVA